jgi:TRAP-type C4-dicarboxylate transport system permease small subunit
MVFLVEFSRWTNRIVMIICALCILSMLAISFIGSLYQAITSEALSWTYSLARQFVPWIGMLSITVAFRHAEHVAVMTLADRLHATLSRALAFVIFFASLIFAILLVWKGAIFWQETTQLVMISDQLQFSQGWIAASVPVSGVIMLVHLCAGMHLMDESEFALDMASDVAGEKP